MKPPPNKKSSSQQPADRRIILEMIEASMRLAQNKGAHPLTIGCNCIVCVNHRKRILAGAPKLWRFRQ